MTYNVFGGMLSLTQSINHFDWSYYYLSRAKTVQFLAVAECLIVVLTQSSNQCLPTRRGLEAAMTQTVTHLLTYLCRLLTRHAAVLWTTIVRECQNL